MFKPWSSLEEKNENEQWISPIVKPIWNVSMQMLQQKIFDVNTTACNKEYSIIHLRLLNSSLV